MVGNENHMFKLSGEGGVTSANGPAVVVVDVDSGWMRGKDGFNGKDVAGAKGKAVIVRKVLDEGRSMKFGPDAVAAVLLNDTKAEGLRNVVHGVANARKTHSRTDSFNGRVQSSSCGVDELLSSGIIAFPNDDCSAVVAEDAVEENGDVKRDDVAVGKRRVVRNPVAAGVVR